MVDTLHARTTHIRVLVVDDHAMFATSISMALEHDPQLRVIGATHTLAGARTWIATQPPDVLLIDHRLPDGYGTDLVPEVKRLYPTVKVVLMSAAVDDVALVSAIENGASGFLSKSATVDELVHALKAAAAGEVLVSPALLARLLPRLSRERRTMGTSLTQREVEVLQVLAEGASNAAIAERLGISLNTVRNHVQSILAKLNVHSKLEALSAAVRQGIIRPPNPMR